MKLNIQSPAKKLRTQYEFCVMDVDAKHRGEGGVGVQARTGHLQTTGEGRQKLTKSCGHHLWMAP